MSFVRQARWAAFVTLAAVGCGTGTDPIVHVLGEAEFGANPDLKATFDDVLVTWLEAAGQPQRAGDTGPAGQDRLPIVIDREETRIFAMDDAEGHPNTLQLLDAAGTVLAETGVGLPPAMVRLGAGTYSLLIRRADSVPADDNLVTFVMPFQRVVAPADQASRAVTASTDVPIAGDDTCPVSYGLDPQISDAISQANVKVLGDSPAIAMGNLFQATAQALSNAAKNATNAQQQAYVTAQASTTMGITTLYSIDTASTGVATARILGQ